MNLDIQLTKNPKKKYTDESALGFGKIFTDHMFIMDYNPEKGWHDHRIVPYDPFVLDPSCMTLHYGQSIFEGLKAYNHNGEHRLFRPKDNLLRMNRSATRMSMVNINIDETLECLYKLIDVEKDWIPKSIGTSLYIRPTMIATETSLGVHASTSYKFFIILSPCGAYYKEGLSPVGIYVEDEYVRAVPGGTGEAKTSGNYAASILACEKAKQKGYTQVLWLDGIERKYIEEVGAMNIFFVIDGQLITPKLNGSILPGITRDSVIKLAQSLGIDVIERAISIDEVFKASLDGTLQECFGSGTAAVISPVGILSYNNNNITINNNQMGEITSKLYDTLTGIQYGTIKDNFNWAITL